MRVASSARSSSGEFAEWEARFSSRSVIMLADGLVDTRCGVAHSLHGCSAASLLGSHDRAFLARIAGQPLLLQDESQSIGALRVWLNYTDIGSFGVGLLSHYQ